MQKQKIPKSLRATVWLEWNGKKFDTKCVVSWCKNRINPFDFEVGHNVPESKGGATALGNLRPICSSCNRSMGNRYTIDQYSALYTKRCWYWKCIREPAVNPVRT